jgi:hypothetical protein
MTSIFHTLKAVWTAAPTSAADAEDSLRWLFLNVRRGTSARENVMENQQLVATLDSTEAGVIARDDSRWRIFRRKYLVNPQSQLGAAALVALITLVPIALLNLSLHLARTVEREALFSNAPQAVALHAARFDQTEFVLVLIASIIFVMGVFAMTVLVTHRTYGAAVGVRRHLWEIRDGNYSTRLKLRDSDNLTELVDPFNEMAAALDDREKNLVLKLEQVAAQADGMGDDGRALAARLREIVETPERPAAGRQS